MEVDILINKIKERSSLDTSSINDIIDNIKDFFLTAGHNGVVNLIVTDDAILGRYKINTKLTRCGFLNILFKYSSDVTSLLSHLDDFGFTLIYNDSYIEVRLPLHYEH